MFSGESRNFLFLFCFLRFQKKKKYLSLRPYTHPDYNPVTASPKSTSGKAACPCFHQRKTSHICILVWDWIQRKDANRGTMSLRVSARGNVHTHTVLVLGLLTYHEPVALSSGITAGRAARITCAQSRLPYTGSTNT